MKPGGNYRSQFRAFAHANTFPFPILHDRSTKLGAATHDNAANSPRPIRGWKMALEQRGSFNL